MHMVEQDILAPKRLIFQKEVTDHLATEINRDIAGFFVTNARVKVILVLLLSMMH